MRALGYDVDIDTPFGRQTVSFDLQKVSADVTEQLVTDAWPQLEARAQAAVPLLVSDAIYHARPEVEAQKKDMLKQAGILAGLLAVAVIGAAWYVGPAPARRRAAA